MADKLNKLNASFDDMLKVQDDAKQARDAIKQKRNANKLAK